MPLYVQVSLEDALHNLVGFDTSTLRLEAGGKRIAAQSAAALNFLHTRSPPVIHRDIKSGNVLLFNFGDPVNVVAKIGDFGSAVRKLKEMQTVPSTGHTAPYASQDVRPGIIYLFARTVPAHFHSLLILLLLLPVLLLLILVLVLLLFLLILLLHLPSGIIHSSMVLSPHTMPSIRVDVSSYRMHPFDTGLYPEVLNMIKQKNTVRVDEKYDINAFGKTLWELLTGTEPSEGRLAGTMLSRLL